MGNNYICAGCYRPVEKESGMLDYVCEKCKGIFAFQPKLAPKAECVSCPYCGFKQYFGAAKARTGRIAVEPNEVKK